MAKRRGRAGAGNQANSALESTVIGFAEELGRFLGTAERKANEWLQQREVITKQLVQIRDTASRYLGQLASTATPGVSPTGRRGRPPGSGRKAPAGDMTTVAGGGAVPSSSPVEPALRKPRRKMSAAARKAISDAQKRRWAKQKRSKK